MSLFDIFNKKGTKPTNKLTPSEEKFMSKEYKAQNKRAKQQTLEASMLEGLSEDARKQYKTEYDYWDASTRHFELNSIIEEEYKQLNSASLLRDEKACVKIIALCKEDIALAPEMKAYFLKSSPYLVRLPTYPAFKRLSIVYENLGNIDEAIKVLEDAIELGFDSDNTKSGMQGRIEKLKNKM